MSIDPVSVNPLASGSALRQDTTTFCPDDRRLQLHQQCAER